MRESCACAVGVVTTDLQNVEVASRGGGFHDYGVVAGAAVRPRPLQGLQATGLRGQVAGHRVPGAPLLPQPLWRKDGRWVSGSGFS